MISWERYEEIKKIISEIFEDYQPAGLPIDVFGLAKAMGIKIIYSSEIIKNSNLSETDIFSKPNSFLHYYDKDDTLVVYIDDIGCLKNRQRFSLAHELGHICLGHTEQNYKNEEEANFFAGYLLSPTSLAMVTGAETHITKPDFIEYAFDVSSSAALISANHMGNRIMLNIEIYDYEVVINEMYKKSLLLCIEKYENNK